MNEIPLKTETASVSDLTARGYLHLPADLYKARNPNLFAPELRTLIQTEIAELEADQSNGASGRFRRHAKALLFAKEQGLRILRPSNGHVVYNQGTYNREFSNVPRALATISDRLLYHPAIHQLVLDDFSLTDWEDDQIFFPLCVGFSIIRFYVDGSEANPELTIGATPNEFHQDGEVYTFAHLLEQENVQGGENYVGTVDCVGKHPNDLNDSDVLARFTLTAYLESYAVYDPLVSHHVNGITRADPSRSAARTVLLIDFTPMKLIHQ